MTSSSSGQSALQIVLCKSYKRDFARLVRLLYPNTDTAETFRLCIVEFVKALSSNPKHSKSRSEPWPGRSRIKGWNFRKLRFRMPRQHGAAAKGRLMYIYRDDDDVRKIILVMLYTHSDYRNRPPDRRLKEILGALKGEKK